MAFSNISQARLALIYPKLSEQIKQIDMMAPELNIQVVQGLRTWAEQEALWLKGRDTNGSIINLSEVVTYAPPGHSWHQFGMAADLCPFNNLTPNWDIHTPQWPRMISVGKSLGLVSGSDWPEPKKDNPHFQLTGKFPVSPNDEVRAIFKQKGSIEDVWIASELTS